MSTTKPSTEGFTKIITDPDLTRPMPALPSFIFASRWLQVPLYIGLIVAQGVYVWLFWQELYYLVLAAFGSEGALLHILDAVTVEGAVRPKKLDETTIMLVVLGLIDVVMKIGRAHV